MKAIFTFLVIIIFWLSALSSDSVSATCKHKEPAKQKTAVAQDTSIIRVDSVSNYSISLNGGSNSVLINNQSPVGKSSATGKQQKDKPNSVEINGEGNSVNIHQSENAGKVNIRQNGKGNQVNISQTSQITVK